MRPMRRKHYVCCQPCSPFPKILVCTDGSPDSEGAVTAALNLAKTTGSTVFLLEVLFYLAGYELQAPGLPWRRRW